MSKAGHGDSGGEGHISKLVMVRGVLMARNLPARFRSQLEKQHPARPLGGSGVYIGL